jgi:protein O-mannosyl-transferase
MIDERLVITESGFLTEFLNQHGQRTDRPFCFILGAGASRASGITTGGEMAAIWLAEMYEAENFDGLSLQEWATPERLAIPGFTVSALARFYPQLYRRRYADLEQAGYAFLEAQMEGKEPSYGYSVLAYLLSETPHRVIVTTNFDNLVADALSIHSSRFPLVVAHDALAQYAAVELRRPLVAKIHGALGFAPKSQPDDIAALSEGWRTALRRILERYTPIVIGYEGNDGSLMSFLQSLPEQIPDRIFWCVHAPNANPTDCLNRVSPEVRDCVRARRGRFVPIRGFDELMAKLLSKLREKGSVPDLYERLKERARQREGSYDEQQRKLFEASVGSRDRDPREPSAQTPRNTDLALTEAVSGIAESRKDKPWWVWAQAADDAPDADTTEAIILQGIEALPNNGDLLRKYGLFLEQERRDMDRAEEFYKRGIEANPKDALSLTFYGDFLERVRADVNKAEEYYRRSLAIDPNDYYTLTRYGGFLADRGQMDAAESHFRQAVEVDSPDEYSLRTYARFLRQVRHNAEKAEELERQAKAVEAGNFH